MQRQQALLRLGVAGIESQHLLELRRGQLSLAGLQKGEAAIQVILDLSTGRRPLVGNALAKTGDARSQQAK